MLTLALGNSQSAPVPPTQVYHYSDMVWDVVFSYVDNVIAGVDSFVHKSFLVS